LFVIRLARKPSNPLITKVGIANNGNPIISATAEPNPPARPLIMGLKVNAQTKIITSPTLKYPPIGLGIRIIKVPTVTSAAIIALNSRTPEAFSSVDSIVTTLLLKIYALRATFSTHL